MVALTVDEQTGTKARRLTVPTIERVTLRARIEGTTPLIVNRMSEAKIEAIEKSQAGAAKTKKPPRDPHAEFAGAQYRLADGGHGFPGGGVKRAMVTAGQRFADEKGTELLGAFTVPAELLRIVADADPRMRTDRVVLAGPSRTTSVAYRPEYWPWAMDVPLIVNVSFIPVDRVINLLQIAGISVGLGEWRVEKKGTFGQFEVVEVYEIQR